MLRTCSAELREVQDLPIPSPPLPCQTYFMPYFPLFFPLFPKDIHSNHEWKAERAGQKKRPQCFFLGLAFLGTLEGTVNAIFFGWKFPNFI